MLHSLSIATALAPGAGARRKRCGGAASRPFRLAILFPRRIFTAVDSIGKESRSYRALRRDSASPTHPLCAGPKRFLNGTTMWVSRAVTEMPTFVGWVWDKIDRGQRAPSYSAHHPLPSRAATSRTS